MCQYKSSPVACLLQGLVGIPTYIGSNGLNSAAGIWSEGLSIELRTFRLISWITLQVVLGVWSDATM